MTPSPLPGRGVAAFALGCAALALLHVDEQRVRALAASTAADARTAAALERGLRGEPDLERRRRQLDSANGARDARRGGAVARLLVHAATQAARNGSTIASVSAAGSVTASAAPATFDLVLDGSYAGVLRTVAALSRGPQPADVSITALTRDGAAHAPLHALIHLQLDAEPSTTNRAGAHDT